MRDGSAALLWDIQVVGVNQMSALSSLFSQDRQGSFDLFDSIMSIGSHYDCGVGVWVWVSLCWLGKVEVFGVWWWVGSGLVWCFGLAGWG